MAASVIDDQLVLRLVLGRPVAHTMSVLTTYTWWWRIGSALRRNRGGALSGPTISLDEAEHAALIDTIDALPSLIDVPDPRDLYPVTADLAVQHGMNLLAAEALAVALVFDAEIVVAVDNPGLRRGAEASDVVMRLA